MSSQARTVQELFQEANQLSPKEQLQATEEKISDQKGRIDYLLENPISVRKLRPLSRDEIYDRF